MTADSMIDYEALAQEAMRNVVRSVLEETAAKGLPGDHHFYITFDTLAPGVILSKRLRDDYAEEMTIVLQHRFWDLIVTEKRFEVKLTFHGIPERLVIPFKSIKVFFDPSVRYGLQFDAVPDIEAAEQSPEVVLATVEDTDGEPLDEATAPAHPRRAKSRSVDRDGSRSARPQLVAQSDPGDGDETAPTQDTAAEDESHSVQTAEVTEEQGPVEVSQGAEIVSLDAFRKK